MYTVVLAWQVDDLKLMSSHKGMHFLLPVVSYWLLTYTYFVCAVSIVREDFH